MKRKMSESNKVGDREKESIMIDEDRVFGTLYVNNLKMLLLVFSNDSLFSNFLKFTHTLKVK